MNEKEVDEHDVFVVPTRCLHFFGLPFSLFENRHLAKSEGKIHNIMKKIDEIVKELPICICYCHCS